MLVFNLRGKIEKILFQHIYNSLPLYNITLSRTLEIFLSATPFFAFSSTQTIKMTSSSNSDIEKKLQVPFATNIEGPSFSDNYTYVLEPPMKMEKLIILTS